MKLVRRICLIALATTLLGFVLDSHANANQFGYGYGYGRWGTWGSVRGFGAYIGAASPYTLGQIPMPPYYSLHPPVYYSVPVPRTYGYSPFPYPGWIRTPDVAIEEPEVIENPHVEPNDTVEETSAKTVSYQIINNPYVRTELRESLSTRYAAFQPKP